MTPRFILELTLDSVSSNDPRHEHDNRRATIVRWIFWAFALVGLYYLLTEHRAHMYEYLPYMLLLACPLLHMFHGHGGHGGHGDREAK